MHRNDLFHAQSRNTPFVPSLSMNQSICLSVSICLCLSIYLSFCLCLSIYLSVCLCQSIFLSVSIHLSFCLSVSIYLTLSTSLARRFVHCKVYVNAFARFDYGREEKLTDSFQSSISSRKEVFQTSFSFSKKSFFLNSTNNFYYVFSAAS